CKDLIGAENRFVSDDIDYDPVGNVAVLNYPICQLPSDCASRTPANGKVLNTYSRGRLVGVTMTDGINANSIQYHENGLVKSVTHANQVVDYQEPDSFGMLRVRSISTNGAFVCTPPVI